MIQVPAPVDPRTLLSAAQGHAKKSWGQNFLVDQNILRLIAAHATSDHPSHLVELGAGLGGLTYYLVQQAGKVMAVERDRDLIPLLRQTLVWAENLEIVEDNALTFDFTGLAERWQCRLTVAGNLPYQLASRIMVTLAEHSRAIGRAVFLVQREVGERACAKAASAEYGLLSVLLQRAFAPRLLRAVPATVFFPRPRVESALIELATRAEVRPQQEDRWLVAAAKAAFSARRKTLRNSLAGGLKVSPALVEKVLFEAEIDAKLRAETLAPEDFARLGKMLAAHGLLAAG